jgi:hypothetical protein
MPYIVAFSSDQYANYVVQCILDLKNTEINIMVHHSLQGKYLSMINHKFSSNVAEKSLEYNGQGVKSEIVGEVIRDIK